MEAMKEKDVEVLFCYEQYDDLTMLQLDQFDKKSLKSIENAVQVSGWRLELGGGGCCRCQAVVVGVRRML